MVKQRRGQSILEYVIILTVIVAAIAYAASKFIQPAVRTSLEDASNSITNATGKLP